MQYYLFEKDLQTDYSMESHTRDLENFAAISRGKRKRARAILDFERKVSHLPGFIPSTPSTHLPMLFSHNLIDTS